ncbi:hypothetical protein KGM48_02360 [Patescibacteria group bacterium]|nr:hypothetical protein [Patescibacteria group bacterium]
MVSAKVWYVEATGHTNEVIAAGLPAENAHTGVLCRDGNKRDLWQCDYSFIAKLLKNEASGFLKFQIFYRESAYGAVKAWPFLRKRRRPSRILRKALAKKSLARARRK